MKGRKRNLLILALLSALCAFAISTTAVAQTEIDINNRTLIRVGADVTVSSNQVVQNALAIGGSVTVQPGGRVTESAIAIGGNVFLKENARVDGDAYAVGGKIIQAEGATIGGAIGTLPADSRANRRWWGDSIFSSMRIFSTAIWISIVLVSAVIGILLMLWLPNFLPTLAAIVSQYPGKTGLWGLGGAIAIVAFQVFLIVSLLGIPLLPIVSLAASIVSWLGSLGVALLIGQRIFATSRRSPTQQFLIGLLVLSLISIIPILGGLLLVVVNIFGLGAILAWKLSKIQPQSAG